MKIEVSLFAIGVLLMSGCASTLLSDDRLKSNLAGTLGVQASDLTIESRREQTPNTYVDVKTVTGKEYSCIVNGGGILSAGMVNPPMCGPKGQPINATPFH